MNKNTIKSINNLLNKNKEKISLIVNNISLLIIIIFIGILLKVDFNIIKTQIILENNEDVIKKINNIALYYHNLLLIIPMVISVYALFKNKINYITILILVLISVLILKYDILNEIHKNIIIFIINGYLKDMGRVIINNQYTKIIIYLIIVFSLIYQIYINKKKSILKIFMLLINLSVLITLFIFHVAVPIGLFKYELNNYKNNEILNTKMLQEDLLCKLKNCYIVKENGDVIKISNIENIKKISNYNNEIRSLRNENKNINYKFIPLQGNIIFNYELIIMKKNNNNEFLLTIENRNIKNISRQSEIIFSFLCINAHGVWIIGGLFLIIFHQRRLERKKI